MQALIGTTEREGYYSDPYLLYAWACTMLNLYRGTTADGLYVLMQPWGGVMCPACGKYYGEHAVTYGCGAHTGYVSSTDITRQCIFLAMVNRDYRIAEVDGMVDSSGTGGYGLIYNSPIYDCQVWGR